MWELSLGLSPREGGDDHQRLALCTCRATSTQVHFWAQPRMRGWCLWDPLVTCCVLSLWTGRPSGFLGQVQTPSVQRANFLTLGRLLPLGFPI